MLKLYEFFVCHRNGRQKFDPYASKYDGYYDTVADGQFGDEDDDDTWWCRLKWWLPVGLVVWTWRGFPYLFDNSTQSISQLWIILCCIMQDWKTEIKRHDVLIFCQCSPPLNAFWRFFVCIPTRRISTSSERWWKSWANWK